NNPLRANTKSMHKSLYGKRPMKDGKTIGRNFEQRPESFGKINGRILASGVPVVRGHDNNAVVYPSNSGNINNYSLHGLESFITDMEKRVSNYHQANPKDKLILADYRQLGDYYNDLMNDGIHKIDPVKDKNLVTMIQKALDNYDPKKGNFSKQEISEITDSMKAKGHSQAVIGLTSISDKDKEFVPTVLRFYADEQDPELPTIVGKQDTAWLPGEPVEVPAPEVPTEFTDDKLARSYKGIHAGAFRDKQEFNNKGDYFDANGFFGMAGLAKKYGKENGINLLLNGNAEVRIADYKMKVNDKDVGTRETRFIEGKIGAGVSAENFRFEAGLTGMYDNSDFDYNGIVNRKIISHEFGQFVELGYELGDGTKIAINLSKNDGKTDVKNKGEVIDSRQIETNSAEIYGTHYFGDLRITPSVKHTWSQDKNGQNVDDNRLEAGLEAVMDNVIWKDVQLLLGGDFFSIKDGRKGYMIKAGVGYGF
ncbi:MAG: hypothetical protein ACTSWQ_04415, partial [Candidatus Thorarchaeota archaeon]